MKKVDIVKQAKIINIIIHSLMVAVGLFLLLFSGLTTTQEIIVISVLCILVGGAKILGYFSNDLYRLAFQFDFASGLYLILFGILFWFVGWKDPLAISKLFGIYVIFDGLLKTQTAFDARKFGIRKWMVVLITAIVLACVGIMALVSQYAAQLPQFVFFAVSFMVDGLVNIWITAYTVRVRAKKKKLEDRFGLLEEERNKGDKETIEDK